MVAEQPVNASLLRRLAAMLYDSLLILAIWMLSSFLIVAATGGEITSAYFPLFLYLEVALFYIYFWKVRGQTLGMQAWKIQTLNEAGEILNVTECGVRFFFATLSVLCLGAGFIWLLFDRQRLAWHDRASGTRVIYLGVTSRLSGAGPPCQATPSAGQTDTGQRLSL